MVFTNILAKGREGVCRLLHMDYTSPKNVVVKGLKDDRCSLQAENEGLFLVELEIGLLLTPSALYINCAVCIIIMKHLFRWCSISQTSDKII